MACLVCRAAIVNVLRSFCVVSLNVRPTSDQDARETNEDVLEERRGDGWWQGQVLHCDITLCRLLRFREEGLVSSLTMPLPVLSTYHCTHAYTRTQPYEYTKGAEVEGGVKARLP